jgi:hypothetical protein
MIEYLINKQENNQAIKIKYNQINGVEKVY